MKIAFRENKPYKLAIEVLCKSLLGKNTGCEQLTNKAIDWNSSRQPFFNAAQITLSILINSYCRPTTFKITTTKRIYNTTTNYTMKKSCNSATRVWSVRCFKSKENAKRVLFFYSLASIKQKKQSEHCMREIKTHGTRFRAWCYEFCFCSHVLAVEKELGCFTRIICMG